MNEKISQQFNQRHQQAVEKKLDRIIQLLEEVLTPKDKFVICSEPIDRETAKIVDSS